MKACGSMTLPLRMDTLQSHPCNEIGFSLCSISHREISVFISRGITVMKTGFSLCGNTTQGKPCSGPVLALYRIAVSLRLLC